MLFRQLFPRALMALLIIGITSTAFSQTRPLGSAAEVDLNEVSCSPDDFALTAPVASTTTTKPVWETKAKPVIDVSTGTSSGVSSFLKIQPSLLAAIDQRLGSRYRWGATGPNRFDCSGFVWSIYQAVGITFERGSARHLFARFAAPSAEDQYKFGTLVFFSGLTHVGVVADANGFYHASRRHGVIYSPFNEYWLKRIDGFRRVPLPATPITD